MAGATEQLDRLLTLIPWLRARPGVGKEEAAEAFGITVDQLERDLDLAVCAEVGRDALAQLDIQYWDDTVTVVEAQAVGQPLRLAVDEALSLVIGLRQLAGSRAVSRDVVATALAKLEEALAVSSGLVVADATPPETDSGRSGVLMAIRRTLTQALEDGCRVSLSYWVPARDEVTEREMDPWGLVVLAEGTYLQGWDYRSDDVRSFRLDRITRAEALDVPVKRTAPDAGERPLPRPGGPWSEPGDQVVVLDLDPSARWLLDYYPLESATEQADGGVRVVLRTGDLAWARRLVMRLGGHAAVVEPAELGAEVARTARAALAGYAE
jgi:proteasome accessory factor C